MHLCCLGCYAWGIGLMAIDRFLYIVHGMKYKIWMYPRRARQMIVAVWIFSFFVGFLPMMGWSKSMYINGQILCWEIVVLPLNYDFFYNALTGFPIISVIIIYSCILGKALKKVKYVSG